MILDEAGHLTVVVFLWLGVIAAAIILMVKRNYDIRMWALLGWILFLTLLVTFGTQGFRNTLRYNLRRLCKSIGSFCCKKD